MVSFVASLLVHALVALLLFSLATSSTEQSSPESFSGTAVVSLTRAAPVTRPAPVPVPHARIAPTPRAAARPSAAPPHPRVLHELTKTAPSAPPNPTPAPVSTPAPVPAPTQAPLSATPAPLPASVPTTAPATVAAVSLNVPPTLAPSPKPRPKPTIAPAAAPTPAPEPSALEATAAPLIAVSTPQPLVTPGTPQQIRLAAPSPGPKPAATAGQQKAKASPGPRGEAPVKGPSAARPIEAPPGTPKPAPASKRAKSLNSRLQSLIPTAAPSFAPAQPKHYSFLNIKVTPEPMPTPPAEVVAHTKYIFQETPAGQRWKVWPLGSAPEEATVKMWVTSVKRIGFVNWCTGWVVRAPVAGNQHWIVESNVSYICAGHLEPFTPPTPEPPNGS